MASPLSATLGALETETLQACGPLATAITISGSGTGAEEALAFQPSGLLVTDRAFDSSGSDLTDDFGVVVHD